MANNTHYAATNTHQQQADDLLNNAGVFYYARLKEGVVPSKEVHNEIIETIKADAALLVEPRSPTARNMLDIDDYL